jgi:hydroxymethylbilane synthase
VSHAFSHNSSRLVLGTRGSALALAQSRHVAAQLKKAHPGLEIEERVIRTTGDVRSAASLPAIGGKGVFTLEIEAALLNGDIDFAVHSLKDLPPDMPAGLCLAAVPQRASSSDVLIRNSALSTQHSALKIGTSSLRRRAMILSLHPDWQVAEIRGNVGTRLEKMQRENFDAIILARAGLQRLQLEPELKSQLEELDPQSFIPAPGQGALGIQSRSDDEQTLELLASLEHDATRAEIIAERAIVRALNAGCSTPLGALAVATPGVLSLRACVLSPDGQIRINASGKGIPERAGELGQVVAQKLLDQGAQELLA